MNIGLSETYVTFNLEGQPFMPGDMFAFYSAVLADVPCFRNNIKG